MTHTGHTIEELQAMVERIQKVEREPVSAGEWNRFLHPDEPEEPAEEEL